MDTISRQDAIKALDDKITITGSANAVAMKDYVERVRQRLIKLPSAEPERKQGRWMYTDATPHRVYCSECYATYVPNKEWIAWAENMIPRNFCPHCGARMEVKK